MFFSFNKKGVDFREYKLYRMILNFKIEIMKDYIQNHYYAFEITIYVDIIIYYIQQGNFSFSNWIGLQL